MFDRLLKQPHALVVHRNGPLAEERRRYLAHCAEQQMSLDTLRGIASYTLLIAKALRLAKRPGELITRTEIEAAADRWVNRRSRRPRRRKNRRVRVRLFTGHAVRWLTFLGRLQPSATVQQPYADQVAEFTDFMLRERGLSPWTIAYSRGTIQQFLAQIDKADLRLKTLTAAEVNELLAQKVRNNEYSRVGIRRWASAMRPFFRFAEERGWCRRGLAVAVKTPPVFQHEGLPLGPSWDDVNRLLAAAQGDCPVDIRDRALLLLLAQGLSLKEIGDHLGHQSPEATRVYAKVDLAALRIVGDFTLEGLL